MKKFEVKDVFKFSEEDTYNAGCLPETGCSFTFPCHFQTDTIEEIMEKMCEFLGCMRRELDICPMGTEEPNRVEWSLKEDEEGSQAQPHQEHLWERGECKLYAVTYTFYVEEVERNPVNLWEM